MRSSPGDELVSVVDDPVGTVGADLPEYGTDRHADPDLSGIHIHQLCGDHDSVGGPNHGHGIGLQFGGEVRGVVDYGEGVDLSLA